MAIFSRAELLERLDHARTVYLITHIAKDTPIAVPVDPVDLKNQIRAEGETLGDAFHARLDDLDPDEHDLDRGDPTYDLYVGMP